MMMRPARRLAILPPNGTSICVPVVVPAVVPAVVLAVVLAVSGCHNVDAIKAGVPAADAATQFDADAAPAPDAQPDSDGEDITPDAGPDGGTDPTVVFRGHARRYESVDPAAFRSGVTILITSGDPQIMSSSGADGAFTFPAVPVGSILDLEMSYPQMLGQASIPISIRTRLSLPLAENNGQTMDVPVITYAWMAQVAYQCGIFPTLEAALMEGNAINPYFTQRVTIFGELRDDAGNPVMGVPRDAIQVVIQGFVNSEGNPSDIDARPAQVCFLIQDVAAGAYAGSPSVVSTATGRFVMFRARNARGTGEGTAIVHARGFVSRNVTLRSSGNIGLVRLSAGVDPMPVTTPSPRTFELDVFPLFARLGCRGCHAPGQIGFETSTPRGGMHLDLSGTPDQAFASLASGGFDNCGMMLARLCPTVPAKSMLLTKPLAEEPPALPDHANTSFDNTSDPNYQAIFQWIQQGARR